MCVVESSSYKRLLCLLAAPFSSQPSGASAGFVIPLIDLALILHRKPPRHNPLHLTGTLKHRTVPP